MFCEYLCDNRLFTLSVTRSADGMGFLRKRNDETYFFPEILSAVHKHIKKSDSF